MNVGLIGSSVRGNSNSVGSYTPTSEVNPDDYFSAYGYSNRDNSLGGKIVNWFTGQSDARREAYNYSQNLAQKRYELDLDNSAVTRRVSDIKNAGLNPWLALQSGIGAAASSSGGSAYSVKKPSPTGIGDAIGSALKILGFMVLKTNFAAATTPAIKVSPMVAAGATGSGGSAESWEDLIKSLSTGSSSKRGWNP